MGATAGMAFGWPGARQRRLAQGMPAAEILKVSLLQLQAGAW